jgi:hypothetical protein
MPQLLETQEPYLRTVLSAASAQLEPSSVVMQPTHAVLLQVQYSGRIFRLNEPIYLVRYAENGYIYLESKLLSIIGYGRSERDAVNSFCEDFVVLWEAIAQSADASLTPEARGVKRKMLNVVNTVVPE